MKTNYKGIVATIWEFVGLLSLALLLVMPNQKSIIDSLICECRIKQNYFGQISYATIVCAGIFLIVYISSFRIFPKEKITKLFAVGASLLMTLTIISLLLFSK